MNVSVAVITGAGGTLCSVMAINLAKQGIKVALLGRTLSKLEKVENKINGAGGNAISVAVDVSSQSGLENAREVIHKKLGACSILINGAGGNQFEAITNINEFDERELDASRSDIKGFFNLNMDKFLDVINNMMGTVLACKVFGADMAKNGSGCLINLVSMNSFRPLSRVAAYGMAKAGIANFTQWLAAYLAPAGIRVNAVAPGFFLNDNSRKRLLNPDGSYSPRGENIIAHTPMKRFGKANELIGLVNYLIDEKQSSFTTGIVFPVDGGFLACSGV